MTWMQIIFPNLYIHLFMCGMLFASKWALFRIFCPSRWLLNSLLFSSFSLLPYMCFYVWLSFPDVDMISHNYTYTVGHSGTPHASTGWTNWETSSPKCNTLSFWVHAPVFCVWKGHALWRTLFRKYPRHDLWSQRDDLLYQNKVW